MTKFGTRGLYHGPHRKMLLSLNNLNNNFCDPSSAKMNKRSVVLIEFKNT